MSELKEVDRNVNFPELEEKVLEFWKKIDAFKTSVKMSEGRPAYSFYDGPPFATGLPHYAGTIKDVVTRYAHQTGHYVERRFGWDCHGLPIESLVENMLGLKLKEDVLKYGISNYNEKCRSIVMKYSKEWERIVTRLGRWIDFENDYKTLNASYMESVWWVFKELFKKGLVYKGFKVMPYSTACTTVLSNFEMQQNYKEIDDPSICLLFPMVGDEKTNFIAWTTTPWTLPSNLALCVKDDMDYVKIKDKYDGEQYIIAECRLTFLYPSKKKKKEKPYEVLEKFKGKDLVGKEYVPLFDYFLEYKKNGAFKIISDEYVTSDSGTGIVHQAPAFGEDDFRICLKHGIIKKGGNIVLPLDDNGRFTDDCPDFKGMYVKDADIKIIEFLKEKKRLIKHESIRHSYPFCWRSDTPLIYKAIPSWFIKVESIKEDLLKNNKKTYWVPNFVKEKRFHNWLENARDWAVSRSRYWGCTIPIWTSEDGEEIVVVGSIEELEKLSGVKVTDLHRHHVDNVKIPSKKGKGDLKRIPDVFDCWFESGAMPYAQNHYPFENKKKFESSFPADFIAEGLDQTRGWFYTLMVLGTALFNKPPFKNLVVNGLVLAEDGKKMSKRLKNYPDPEKVINECGADALRLYLINSPVVRAECLKFSKKGVNDIVKIYFLRWFNCYRLFVNSAKSYYKTHNSLFSSEEIDEMKFDNVMDIFIISKSQTWIKNLHKEMGEYKLYNVLNRFNVLLENMTHWFVRLNKERILGKNGQKDWKYSLAAFYKILLISCQTMAPIVPFITESMYQNLKTLIPVEKREESLHYCMIPKCNEKLINLEVEKSVELMKEVIICGRKIRNKKNPGVVYTRNLRFPIPEYVVISLNEDDLKCVKNLSSYIVKDLNVDKITFSNDLKKYFKLSAKTNDRILGKKLKKKLRSVKNELKKITHSDMLEFLEKGEITVLDEKLTKEELQIKTEFIGDEKKYENESVENTSLCLLMDFNLSEDLILRGQFQTIASNVQKFRKDRSLLVEDEINCFFLFMKNGIEKQAFVKHFDDLKNYLKNTNVFEIKKVEEVKGVVIGEKVIGEDVYKFFFVRK